MGTGRQLKLPQLNYKLPADTKLFLQKYGPIVSRLKRDPVFVARFIHGVVIPPHQQRMWRAVWQGFSEYHFPASRGTAKSATISSMAPVILAETTSRRKYLSLSASKFRGGKTIMEEAEDFAFGRFKDQRPEAPYTRMSFAHKAGLKREGDRWTMPFKTHSTVVTIPTGNFESARGLRANWLNLDEADNWERVVIDKYFGPFLNVGSSFEFITESDSTNTILFTGTVTYSHKDWAKTLDDRELMLNRRFQAHKALKSQDYETYKKLMDLENGRLWNLSVGVQRWDYTDLVIPTSFGDYDVYYPVYNRVTKKIVINPSYLIKYDRRDKESVIYTYPIEKEKIEATLDDGNTDFDTWAAENRAHIIRTDGTVYPPHLLDKATDTELLDDKEAARRGWDLDNKGSHFPPLMWECKTPCVLGVDPARTSDFAAFVVIRMGELGDPNKEYDPNTGEGQTPWNNVIWAEGHRRLTIKEVCNIIYELKKRYNIISSSPNPSLAYGIGIDARGAMAGATVRDELARPSPETDEYGNVNPNWIAPQIIYDPTDKEYQHLAMRQDAWAGLRLLWTTDALNTEWVSFSKGQLEQAHLYIAKFLGNSERDDPEGKLNIGYAGVQSLKNQLMRIQSKPTKYHMQYLIPGNEQSLQNKDDLFKAFLYAVSALRGHLGLLSKKKSAPPAAHGILIRPRMNRVI